MDPQTVAPRARRFNAVPSRVKFSANIWDWSSGVVSGTTVRALVLGRFSQKIIIELKDNAKK